MVPSIGEALWTSADRYPDRIALWAKDEWVTYFDLFGRARRIAGVLASDPSVRPGDRVAILCDRTTTAYAAIVGTILAGAVYTPLNPRFPIMRNRTILDLSGARALIVDDRNAANVEELLEGISPAPLIVAPENGFVAPPGARFRVSSVDPAKPGLSREQMPRRAEQDLAYILFTSGSTGTPKGVPISHGNLLAYVANATRLAEVTCEDRIIQLADLTFDLSVHDMFVSWFSGAALFSVPERATLMAHRFVDEHEITGWFSVPSTAGQLKQAGAIGPGTMPSLRFTFFCGEPLPGALAESWAAAAPNSAIFNLYGPTEATVVLTSYRYHAGQAEPPGAVPVGEPFPDISMGLFEVDGTRVKEGDTGEICLSGPQVMSGYWREPQLNENRFFEAEGKLWFRTGDLGRHEAANGYIFAGRIDHQVKIRGFRVEVGEIESAVRVASGRDLVAVLPWPTSPEGGALGCVAFVAGPKCDSEAILAACRQRLPDYMVPSRVIAIPEMALNENGKINYLQLAAHPALSNRQPGTE